jgi:Ran GTPase-activating protein (RanGAP) involved in mRNA processing and transport
MMSQREKLLLAKKDRLVLHPDSIQTHVILNKYQATEKRLDQLKTQLSPEQCSINKLEISHNQFTDKKAQMLCQALCSNNSLKSILIGQCRLRNSHLKDICSSIAQSELHVNEVSFKHLRVNKKGADAITQMMQQCK